MDNRIIKACMTLKGYTQPIAAKKLGMNSVLFNQCINGKAEFPADKKKELCKLLDSDIDTIFFTDAVTCRVTKIN